MFKPGLVIKKTRHFISEQIWAVRLEKLDPRRAFLIKQLRIITLAIRGFKDDNCLTSATALTFYTLFSIVPILALVFAIAKGFGIADDMQIMILNKYKTYETVLTNAFVYANDMLATTNGGAIAGVGIVLLLWSVLKLLISVEDIFNQIWEIKRGRSWVRKITDYLTIVIVAPILFMISGGLTVALQAKMGDFYQIGFIGAAFVKLFAYSLVAGVFTFLYMALPNTKVSAKAAFAGGVIAMVLFELLGWGYIKFQIGASRLSAIYGGFAALPLFLIWVQYTWYIVLFGAQIAYANQNAEKYELAEDIKNLSIRYKRVLSLLIANFVAKRFHNGEKAMSATEIAKALDLPIKLARNVTNEFVETGIFVEVKTDEDKEVLLQPGVTESKFDVKFLINTLDKKGVNSIPIADSDDLKNIHILMEDLDKSMDTTLGHTKLKDIIQ